MEHVLGRAAGGSRAQGTYDRSATTRGGDSAGTSSFATTTCKLASDGDRVSVTFDGLTLGIFAGDVRFTVYKGSNLLRQEAVAATEEPSVAYIYKAG